MSAQASPLCGGAPTIHFFVCALRDQGAVGLAMLLILNNDEDLGTDVLELKLVCPCKKVDMFGSV